MHFLVNCLALLMLTTAWGAFVATVIDKCGGDSNAVARLVMIVGWTCCLPVVAAVRLGELVGDAINDALAENSR